MMDDLLEDYDGDFARYDVEDEDFDILSIPELRPITTQVRAMDASIWDNL